ncbi:MAG: hypothetical protein GWP05_05400 [Anaerolineaceae bacterium]|nr:hypothetical protein [Anaerolineaceae bacterium]
MQWVTMLTALLLVLCLSPVWAIADDDQQSETGTAAKADPANKTDGQPQDKQDKEATPTATCTVKETTRTVQWRPGPEAEWRKAKVGDRLPLGADIRTGLRASCRLEFSENSSVVEVQPITQIRIGEYEKVGRKIRTRLYLKQGAVRADVERVRFQSDFAIVSPEVTLAVRGTTGIELKRYMDTGSHSRLMFTGLLKVTNNQNGRSRKIRPGDRVAPGMRPAIRNVQKLRLVKVYDIRGGNTPAEMRSIANRVQTFVGTGNQAAPGGTRSIGGRARTTSANRRATNSFFRKHPRRLPNISPKRRRRVLTRIRASSSGDNDEVGSGM